MENLSTYNFSISRLKEYFPAASRTGIGEDLCLLNVRFDENIHPLEHPFRFDGVLLLYCIKGNMRMSINLNEYDITDNSLILCTPQNILKVADIPYPEKKSLHYVVIAMSQKFASELRLDFKRIISEGMPLAEAPVATLSEEAKEMVARYLELVAGVSKSDMKLKDEALRSLMSSLFCIVAGIWMEKMDELKVASAQTTTRSRMIFEHFIRLVSEYHTRHRNVGFYADKLCLTPKYLSKLIKTASGKSAPEWIDSYVILEAKNLLKYSDITIKEIVYRLNFPNQSVFYKFFKARTGMTPSEYRNS
ncbi:MAG: AraC family transcriptional regulator [Bacteroidales bacterium]|nr:AraC family transcriptional regulator [Bacteroidales bacterium]